MSSVRGTQPPSMRVRPIKTRKFLPPKDDLWQLLDASLPKLAEDTIVAVSSKIVAIGEGRCVPIESVPDKDHLITKEADLYLPREHVPGGWVMHTIAHGVFAPSAGVDASNGADHYVLWPEHPARSAAEIWRHLRRRHGLHHLGVVLTDSRSIPLRRGVVGYALAHHGFRPMRDYRGTRDLFGRKLRISQSNVADAVATAAVLVMGEGREQTPLAVVTGVHGVRFTQRRVSDSLSTLEVPLEDDLYAPFLRSVPWRTASAKTAHRQGRSGTRK